MNSTEISLNILGQKAVLLLVSCMQKLEFYGREPTFLHKKQMRLIKLLKLFLEQKHKLSISYKAWIRIKVAEEDMERLNVRKFNFS